MMRSDSFKHRGMRKQMIEQLKKSGLEISPAVLEAMASVPRHFFLDSVFENFAYQEKAFEIGDDQTISRPSTVARQSTLLQVFPRAKVLEVGTGSGYQAAVLEALGAEVYSIERQRSLYGRTSCLLKEMHSNIRCFYGDGYQGLPQYAPFDRILVTCGASVFPSELLAQLKIGGIMVVPVGSTVQIMTRIVRTSETEVETSQHGDFNFVPMLNRKV